MTRAPLVRRILAEFAATGMLVTAVVGSGIAASSLSPDDVGLQLLENAFATALALGTLILVFGPVSGAHLNPVVSFVDWWLGRRSGAGLRGQEVAAYVVAQLAGGVVGAIVANLMYALPPVTWSTSARAASHLWLSEVLATAGLVFVIVTLARTGRASATPVAVGAYIGAAYWVTSSTAFANPAVTLGRAFTDTFTGIAPGSVPGFIAAQLAGALLGAGFLAVVYPRDYHSAKSARIAAERPGDGQE